MIVQVSGVRLYRDDLEQLLGMLRARGMEVNLRDNAFEYEALDDLSARAGPYPRAVGIEARVKDSYYSMSLDFGDKRWHIFAGEPALFGIARECEALLRRRQTTVEHLPIFWVGMAGWLTLWLASVVAKSMPSVATHSGALGAALLSAAAALWLYYQAYPKVILRFAHEAGFLRRNRDQLLLLVAGAIIGAAANWVVGLWIKNP